MADHYFDLSIRLTNAGMQSDRDIAQALREVAAGLEFSGQDPAGPTPKPIPIRDVNGHKVGSCRVVNSRRSTEGYR